MNWRMFFQGGIRFYVDEMKVRQKLTWVFSKVKIEQNETGYRYSPLLSMQWSANKSQSLA